MWYIGPMTETPKRGRGRPKGNKLSAETKAKISEAARRQHADPEAHARWRASMEVVWQAKRDAKAGTSGAAETIRVPASDVSLETPTADESYLQAGTQTRLDLLAAGLKAATGKPVRFVDVTDQIEFEAGTE